MKNKPAYSKSKPKVKFSIKEKEILKEFFKKTKNLKAKTRCNGVLLRTKGYSLEEIADILGKTDTTIRNWTQIFKKHGVKGFVPKPQPGNHRILNRKQKDEIKTVIKKKKPYQLGIKSRLKLSKFWNIPTLKDFVKNHFSVEYQSDRSYHRLFHYCGFSFHKPMGKDKRQDKTKVLKFENKLKKKLKQIKQEEKRGYKSGSFWLPMKPNLNMRQV